MPVRIRLQRHGRKGKPFYWIVAADSRAKRDGKFLEKLGTYNPNSNPAQIELNVDGSVKWLRNGAQPSETARRILSYKGVMLKYHLLRGVDKGALTEEQAGEKFESWLVEKAQKIEGKKELLAKTKADTRTRILEAEREISEKRKAATEEVVEESTETANEVAEASAEEAVATPEENAPEAAAAKETKEPEAKAEKADVAEAVAEKPAEAVKKDDAKATETPAAEAVEEKQDETAKTKKTGEDKAPEA